MPTMCKDPGDTSTEEVSLTLGANHQPASELSELAGRHAAASVSCRDQGFGCEYTHI